MIPENLKDGIDRYVKDHIKTGSFLNAVLENDFAMAVGTADQTSMLNLKGIVVYVFNEIPSDCWGSKEKVAKWLNTRKTI